MSSTESAGWLRDYVEHGSGEAFGQLVAGHFDLVYSAALRRVGGDAHLAQDVAQNVFTDLARKAKSLPREVYLAGWLYRHTCFTAANAVRGERRRQTRERHAVEMNAPNDPADAVWQQLAPVLDEAMKELSDPDRDAILLRYFERQPFRVVGDTLGTSEDGARKRVDRALEKLRGYFGRRGVTVSAVVLGEVLNAQAVVTAPAGVATVVTASALAAAAVGGGAVSTIIKLLTMTKLKIAGVALMAGLAAIITQQAFTNQKLRQENRALSQQAAQMDDLRAENDRLAKAQTNTTPAATDEQLKDLLRLRAQVGGLKKELADTQTMLEKTARLTAQKLPTSEPDETADPQRQLAIAKMNFLRTCLLASLLYAGDNQGQFPTNFDQMKAYGATNYAKGAIYVTPDSFEVVYQGKPDGAMNPTPSETIAIRERQPVQGTDGGWFKAYGFLDGHSEIHKEMDFRNFDAWESQRLQKPQTQ
jgi:RNA polymerase sigma factor (sigma-70 family)